MTRFFRAQVTVPRDTLISADNAVMTWHFRTNEVGSRVDEAEDIVSTLKTFYNVVDVYFSSYNGTQWDYTVYDLEDAPQRVPVYQEFFSHTMGTAGYPAEVAMCLTMQALPASGLNQRRRRGRVYLGPLSTTTGAASDGEMRPDPAVRTIIANAAADMLPSVVGAGSGSTLELCVFSRATFDVSSQLIDAFVPVEQVYVDNAFDTQRRRGVAATARTIGV